jgi:hypothetical protein
MSLCPFDNVIGIAWQRYDCHTCRGRVVPKATTTNDMEMNTVYTSPPPKYPSATDREKREVEIAGPIVRVIETRSWASPFVAPKDARLGDAADI